MSLFKKPKRNFRQRVTRNDSDEENGGDKDEDKSHTNRETSNNLPSEDISDKFLEKRITKSVKPEKNLKSDFKLQPQSNVYGGVINPSPAFNSANNAENKSKVANAVGTLSFEEEDDGEVFKVRKSSYSRRLAKQLEKERRKKSKESETGGDNPSVSIGPHCDEFQKKKQDEQPLPQIMNGDEFEEMELDSDGEEDQDSIPDPFKKILESGSIPDAAMIHAARKRRQMAREMSDFIVLDDNESPDKNNSRLIRDDDNDRSDDEDSGGRLSFSVSAPLAKDRAREALLAISQKENNEGTDEEADEELERWEQEQIRKGVSIPQVPVPQPETQIMPTYSYPSEGNTPLYTANPYNCPIKQEPECVPPALSIPNDSPTFTVEGVRQQIRDRLDSMKQTNRAHIRESDKIVDDVVTIESRVVEREEKGPRIARAFTFYQEMRGYVTDLVECLNEKVGIINTLEHNIMQLLRQRANRLVQRRQQDIKDQSEEFPAVFKKAAPSSGPDLFNREKTAAETIRARRAAEREGRRTRRRRFREAKGTNIKHYEGMSSDDEEIEADVAQFNMEKERLVAEAISVFDDVMEEFSSVSYIKSRFEQWKREYPESYSTAYIGLCLPRVFTPFIRLQLLTWNPLEESSDFEETRWFESLMFYSYLEGLTLDDLRTDSDTQLIPILIERIIIPKLTDLAENVWDPMSTSQTLRFVSLIRKLINEYPTVNGKSKKTQALLKAAVSRMRKTLDDDVFIPTYHKTILENKLLGANTFFHRQYWSCVKLLRNFLSWQGIISDQLLQELALHGLLNRYLLYAMHNSPSNKDSLEKAKMITSTIPRCWFTKRDGDNTIPQLEMFCRYLNTLAEAMDKNVLSGTISDKTEAKENIKEIAKMLVNIGAMNHALVLVNQFSLKDLKSMVSSSKE